MKKVYSAKDSLEAHDLRLYFETHGIQSHVVGDNSALESVFSFTPDSAPAVFVDEADFDNAADLLQKFYERPQDALPQLAWACPTCGEEIEDQFEVCWNCESPRGHAPLSEVSPSQRSDESEDDELPHYWQGSATRVALPKLTESGQRDALLEIAIVLSIAWFPYFVASILPYESGTDTSFTAQSVWQIVNCLPIVAVVLYLMHRSGLPWQAYGIRHPDLVRDLAAGAFIWFLTMIFIALVQLPLAIALGGERIAEVTSSAYEFQYPNSMVDFATLVALAACIGISEELAMRSYLIPRLEQLLQSTTKSVIISSFLFASYHCTRVSVRR